MFSKDFAIYHLRQRGIERLRQALANDNNPALLRDYTLCKTDRLAILDTRQKPGCFGGMMVSVSQDPNDAPNVSTEIDKAFWNNFQVQNPRRMLGHSSKEDMYFTFPVNGAAIYGNYTIQRH